MAGGHSTPRVFAVVAAIVGLVWLTPLALARYEAEARIPAVGSVALEALRTMGSPGDVVLSNALTTGTIESFTGLEDPLEGRQPLIEDPAFPESANQLLLDVHDWFAKPTDRVLPDRLGVRWVLVVDDAAALGTDATLGGGVARPEGARAARRLVGCGDRAPRGDHAGDRRRRPRRPDTDRERP